MHWAISEWPALAAAQVALAPVVGLWTLVVTFWERAARWMNAPLCSLEVEEVSVGTQEAATSCAGLYEVTISGGRFLDSLLTVMPAPSYLKKKEAPQHGRCA